MAAVRFQLGVLVKCPAGPATEHVLNNSQDFVTATVTACVPASHTPGRVSRQRPAVGVRKKEGELGAFNRKNKNYKATRLRSGHFYRADMGRQATWGAIPGSRHRTQCQQTKYFSVL